MHDNDELGLDPESTLPTDADLSQSPEDTDDEAQEDSTQAPEPAQIDPEGTYVWNGKTVTGKEILAGALMQDDYTRKTQELAAQRQFYETFAGNLQSQEGVREILQVVASQASQFGVWPEVQRLQELLGQPSDGYSQRYATQATPTTAPPFDPEVADPDVVAVWQQLAPLQYQIQSILAAVQEMQQYAPALQQLATQHQREAALREVQQYVPDATEAEVNAAVALIPGDDSPALKLLRYRQMSQSATKPKQGPPTAKGGRGQKIQPGSGDPAYVEQVLDEIEAMTKGG